MTQHASTLDIRHRAARESWNALPHGGRDAILLRVQCGRSHHLARVCHSADGLVVVSPVRARSHGSRDRVDQPHGDHPVDQWVDYLVIDEPAVDDAIPAWCDCGPRTLSRVDLLQWLSAGERRVIVN